MKPLLILLTAAVMPAFTSCQSTGNAGDRGVSGVSGQSYSVAHQEESAPAPVNGSPFHPQRPLVSARYVPGDHYWGFGGGYSYTRSGAGGSDPDNENFLRSGDHYCWGRYHCHGGYYPS